MVNYIDDFLYVLFCLCSTIQLMVYHIEIIIMKNILKTHIIDKSSTKDAPKTKTFSDPSDTDCLNPPSTISTSISDPYVFRK